MPLASVVKRAALIVAIATTAIIAAPTAVFAGTCGSADTVWGCVGQGGVDVGGNIERPGSTGPSGGSVGDPGWTPHPDWEHGGDGTPGSNIGPGGETAVCGIIYPRECTIIVPPPAEASEAPSPIAPVTINDIASFVPDAPTVTTEPGAWGLLKAHTNVIANASQHVRSGTLLGGPAEVNFIPVGYAFDYGDGEATTTTSGGSTWATLGLAEFSKTATSHRYTSPGTKTITAEVTYAAEYRVGGGAWLPVVGTLTVPTDTAHTITILRNSTVGVDKPCRPGSSAVGC